LSTPNEFRLLFFGDVFASPGRRALFDRIEYFKKTYEPDFIIINGENAAGGFGISRRIASAFFRVGIDVITSGNHIWDNKDSLEALEDPRILRPANYPEGNQGAGVFKKKLDDGTGIAVINLQGRVFMEAIDCPFRKLDSILEELEDYKIKIVDFHAEATGEKRAMFFYAAGRVSALIGTHTHVQTADETIVDGTAYITDAGMVGIEESVIGMKKERVIERMLFGRAKKLEPEKDGEVTICGVFVIIDRETGQAISIERIRVRESEIKREEQNISV